MSFETSAVQISSTLCLVTRTTNFLSHDFNHLNGAEISSYSYRSWSYQRCGHRSFPSKSCSWQHGCRSFGTQCHKSTEFDKRSAQVLWRNTACLSSDTSSSSLRKAFKDIEEHKDFQGLKLKLAIWHVKQSSKKPFLDETPEDFGKDMETFTTGIAQAHLQRQRRRDASFPIVSRHERHNHLHRHIGAPSARTRNTRHTARRDHPYARSPRPRQRSERQRRPRRARDCEWRHQDVNNEDTQSGKTISAEAVGDAYLWLSQQKPTLYTHELDLRPAQETF
ncbi:hypothetical protein MRB53_041877 [Persea americana]|nr:hypothetical protein MRB53_041877 [Persea americana]